MAGRSIQLRSPLRRRRVLIWLGRVALVGGAAFTIAGLVPLRSTDWQRFDHQSVVVRHAIDGDSFLIETTQGLVPLHLLGIEAPPLIDVSTNTPAHGGEASAAYLRNRAERQTVMLRLDTLQTRNNEGELLAYVYLTDTDCLNADAIHDGMAYADRRTPHAFLSQYEQAENEARKKQRGLWKGLTEDMMPAWRRAWLHSLVKNRLN